SIQLPTGLQQVYDQSVSLFKQGQFNNASKGFEKLLTDSPEHSASIYLLGYCYYKMNEPEKAFALCDRAEKIRPKSGERCLSLVHIALATGHYERAITEISALYHDFPDNPEISRLYHQITDLTKGREIEL